MKRAPFALPASLLVSALTFGLVLGATVGRAQAGGAARDQPSPSSPSWVAHPNQPFEIMTTEVTVAEFLACVKTGKCSQDDADPQCNVSDPLKTDHPVNCITHGGAEKVCGYLGGRLCSSVEWLAACRGGDGRAFPYGAEFSREACNVGSYENPSPSGKTTVAVASMPDCEGGLPGVFDIGGNLSEWMSDCKEDYCKFRGAAYMTNEPVDFFAGCSDRCSGNKPDLKSGSVGARCCRDASAAASSAKAATKAPAKARK